METGNLCYLVKDWDEFRDVKLEGDPKAIWDKIYEEYTTLADDNKSIIYYKLIQKIAYLELREFVCSKVSLMLYEREEMDEKLFHEYMKVIRKFGFSYDKNLPKEQILEKLLQDIKFAKNQIEIKKSELEAMKSDSDPVPLMKQIVLAEQALGKNVIDPKITSVEKWVYYMERIKEMNQERTKSHGKQL